jgi:hypothetical protein
VLGGSRVGVTSEDLRVAQWHPGLEGVGDRHVTQGVGAMWRGIPAAFATLATMR